MNKRDIFFKISYIFIFLFIIFFILFLLDKISLIFVLCVLELFLISITISCYFILQSLKDDFTIVYRIRYFFLIFIDFIILLALIGTLHNEFTNL